jgi:F subunit of K+-transporting ATPase (Potass_KdpF)
MGDGAIVMTTSQVIGLGVAVVLLLYFIAAMVRPERF